MKNFKKFLALLLCTAILLTSSVLTVSAANYSTNYKSYSTPSDSSDYAYWNGSRVVKASGTTKKEIQWMQAALNYCIANKGLNASKLDVDGSFGPASKATTAKFQKEAGLSADGSFGPATIKKMKSILSNSKFTFKAPAKTSSNSSAKKLYWPVAKASHKIGGIGPNSDFGPRNVKGGSKDHKGIDLAVGSGTNIYSVAAGTVTAVGYNSVRGNYVIVYHENLGISSLYQHLKSYSVKKGSKVSAGQNIAKSGNTGVGTGAHLHFGLMTGKATDPNYDQHGKAFDPLGSKVSYTYWK